jgi:O-antigen/teichoic acid export membrane protein
MSNEIETRMAHGAMWMLLFKLFERSLGLISTLILVRLLSPADFGVVAMATSFIFMGEMLVAFGFDLALIQNQEATEEHYHTAWTCNVLLGLLIALVMLGASTAIARFYGRPEVFWVVCVLAIGPLINGFENIGVVAFRKDMQFRREFVFQLSRKLIGFMVVVPLAFFLQSYWALVVGILTSKLAGTCISYLVHPFRPRFSLTRVRGMLGFSKWLLLNNVVGFLKERSSDFVIGRLHGAAPLGIYNVSYEFAIIPTTELAAPINRALLPGFARIASDPVAMRAAYANAIGILAILAVPAAAGIFAVSPFLVPVILGTKWLAAVPLMEILALNGGLLLFHSSICTVLIANGHPDRVTKTNALYVVILLILLGALAPAYGITGAAIAALSASILATPVYLVQVRRSVGVPTMVDLRVAVRPILAALAMAGLIRWALPNWTASMSLAESLGWLIGGILFGIATYAAAVVILWAAAGRPDGAERALLERLRQLNAKRRGVSASTAP